MEHDFYRTLESTKRTVNAYVQGFLTLLHPGEQIGKVQLDPSMDTPEKILAAIEAPITHTGRTGASIHEKNPRRAEQNTVLKENETEQLASIEERLLQGYAAHGFDVPKIHNRTGKIIEMEKIAGKPFAATITDLVSGFQVGSHTDAIKRLNTFFFKALDLSIALDGLAGTLLTEEDKKYLQGYKVAKLASKFNCSEDEVQEHRQAYRIMESLGFVDERFIELFKPFQEKYDDMIRKYGKWIVSASSANIMVPNPEEENPQLKAIDFNHAEYSPLQVSMFYIADAYIPKKKLNHLNMNTTPISEDEKITDVAGYYFTEWNKKHPENTIKDFQDFRSGYMLTRVILSIRQIGHTLEKAKDANLVEYYDYLAEASHYYQILKTSLCILNNPRSGIKNASEISDYILDKTTKHIQGNTNEDTFQDALAYLQYS
jgi:hypothetical protein